MRDGPHTRHNLHPKAAGPLPLVLRVPRDNIPLEAYAWRGNLRVPPVQQLLPQAPTQRLLLMYITYPNARSPILPTNFCTEIGLYVCCS